MIAGIFVFISIIGLNAMEHKKESHSEMQEERPSGLEILIEALESDVPSNFPSKEDKKQYLQAIRDELNVYTIGRNEINETTYMQVINSLNAELERAKKLPIIKESK